MKPRVKIVTDKVSNQTWCALVAKEGDKEPTVAFYDCRYDHTDLGQFVSQYYVSTLIEDYTRISVGGLNLDAGVDSWTIYGEAMGKFLDWMQMVIADEQES